MALIQKTLFTGFAPNITRKKIVLSLGYLFLPWRWHELRRGMWIKKCEDYLKDHFRSHSAKLVDSGRTAINLALKASGIDEGDEVLVSGYTCQVVINAIKSLKGIPVFIDIDKTTLNIDIDKIEGKITDKTKVIIVQHTFGLPVNMHKVHEVVRKQPQDIKIIEDCAHAFYAEFDRRPVGTWGDIGIFSFGANKVLSCVRGGAIITNNEVISHRIDKLVSRLPQTVRIKVVQHLLYYPIFFIGRKTYGYLKLGQILLFLARKLHLTPALISSTEKHGKPSLYYPARIPNSLAHMLYFEFKGIADNLCHRARIAKYYEQNLFKNISEVSATQTGRIYWYYTIYLDDISEISSELKRRGIIVGTDWSGSNIVPCSTSIEVTGYKPGSCPVAEKVVKHIINLPTNRNITLSDVKEITESVNTVYD